ncbi:MAG: YfhO family protein, partial [Verrucomicrobia bacterium]|nr:YfhO family protein [Verrucomicrobiota bacterium]
GLIRVPIFAFAAYLLVRLLKTPVAGNALKISLALMSLIWADQIIFNHRPSPTVKSWVYKPKMAQDQLGIDVPSGPGAPRFLPNAQIMAELGGTAFVIPEEQVAYCRMACFDNLTLFDHLPKLHGFFPMDLRSFQEILPWFHVMPDEEVRPLIEFAGMAYTQRPGKPIEWIKKWNPQPLITAGQKPVAVETGGVFTLLQEGRFKPTEEVYLYPSWANDLQDVVSGQASIEAIDWREQSIRFKVNAAKPSIVVLAQTYYHPWVARIGDTVVPLRRANHSFTALKVPAGSHQVVLTYEDPKFRLGLVITGFACLVVIVLLTVTFKKKPQLPAV